MYSLPTTVEINGASFGIRNKGDFRMVLDCFSALNDTELSDIERAYSSLIIFYKDFNSIEDVLEHIDEFEDLQKEMLKFFNGGEDNLESNTDNYKIIDWNKDSNLICSAINNVAGKEIRSEKYLHWWTFLGYYMSINESLLTHIISIRYKIAKNESLDKSEKKFRQSNPQYFNLDMRSNEQKEADDYIKQLWGKS